MAGIKKSRGGFTGAVTKVLEKLSHITSDEPEEIAVINPKEIERLLTSLKKTEAGFFQNIEDAQAFLPDGEGEESFTTEEDFAMEAFQDSISTARDSAEQLLALKNILTKLGEFKTESSDIQEFLEENPDSNQSTSLQQLRTLYLSIKDEWRKENLPTVHSLRHEVGLCNKTITSIEATVAAARDRSELHSMASSTHSTSFSSTSDRVCYNPLADLPTIKVPTFAGNILEWSTFWAAFRSTIDSRTELSNTQKLQYLRQAVKDPDLQSLLHSPLETEDMYVSVIAELKDRFNKTREIHSHLADSLIKLTTPKQTRVDLRRMVDSVKKTIDSLKHTEHYNLDAFLSSLVYLVLPQRLQTLWDQHTKKDKGVPPVSNLLKFIKEHAETLPSVITPHSEQPSESSHKKTPRQPDKNPGYSHPRGRVSMNSLSHDPTSTTAPFVYKWECTLCRPEKHPLHVCSKWAALSLAERLNHITSKSLCSNCLAGGHSTYSCKSTYRCRYCGQPHHSSIHPQSVENSTAPIHSTSVQGDQVPDALKTTAQVLLLGPTGKTLQARALLDSGAGICLASKRVAQLLDLPLESSQLELSSLQGAPCTTSYHKTTLIVSPLQNREIRILCQPKILQNITCDLPPQPIQQVTDLPHLMGLPLADPSYHIPSQIDILLGTNLFPQILTNQSTRVGTASEPVAQATVFGWALCGPVRLLTSSTPPPTTLHNLMPTSSLNSPHLDEQVLLPDPKASATLMSASARIEPWNNPSSLNDLKLSHSAGSICSSNSSVLQPELLQPGSSSALQPELLQFTSSNPVTSPKKLELQLDEDNLSQHLGKQAELQVPHLPLHAMTKELFLSNPVVFIFVDCRQRDTSLQTSIASTSDDSSQEPVSVPPAELPHTRSLTDGFPTPPDLLPTRTHYLVLTSRNNLLEKAFSPLHATSSITEKLDTFYLTRLLLCEYHPSTYSNLLINNLMLTNSVSINPATLHYWIDSSIYSSWLHDRKQQLYVVTNNSISIMQTTRSSPWHPKSTALIPKQPSENGLLEEQYITIFTSPPSTAENYCKRPPIILDNLPPESSISNLPESHSHTQPVQPATRSIDHLILGRLCIFLLMCLHIIPQHQQCHYFFRMDEHHPSNHCNRLQSTSSLQPFLFRSNDSTEESVEDSTKEPSLPLPPGGCLGRNQPANQQPEVDTADPVFDQMNRPPLPSSIIPACPGACQSIRKTARPAVLQPP